MNNYDKQKIKLAWANGLTVQFWDFYHETWIDVYPDDDYLSLSNSSKWRIKPKAQITDECVLSDSDPVMLKSAIMNGADLVDGGHNTEYTRGVCEIIARLFPVSGVCTSERADWVMSAMLETD